jgi:hypothetical protein
MQMLIRNTDANFAAHKAAGKTFFQPKLTINQPGDAHEQEADAMADKVMRMTDSPANESTFFKPAGNTLQRKCAACEEAEKHVHRKESNGGETHDGPGLDSYISNLGSAGQSMSASTRSFFEPRFGYDFSNVKVHTDSVAAKSAQSINALAYTSGNNIVFNSGQYSPDSDNGKKLMAHELTHVVQQQSAKKQMVQMKSGDGCGKDFLYQFDAVSNSEQEKDHRGVPRVFYKNPTGKAEDVAQYYNNTPLKLTSGMSLPAGQMTKFGWRAVCYSPAAGAPEMIYWVLDEYLSKPKKEDPPKPTEKPTDKPADPPKTKDVDPGKKPAPTEEPGLFSYCEPPIPEVDDAVVQGFIDKAIKNHTDAAGKTDYEAAWGELLAMRNKKEGCCDVNLAAAEHYLYARWQASEGRSLSYAELLDLGNYIYKSVHGPFPNAGSGFCPKTRSSLAQLKWGTKGTLDGKAEYDKAHGGGWGSSPTNRFPDGTWYDKDGKLHMGAGPKI